jgi:glutamate dehydrogenase
MKLLAAFNHRHIFLDPNPDPQKTYEERLRLFNNAQGWEHYDTSLLSEGGAIYDRHAKSIVLSPESKKMLGALEDELPAESVIRKMLRMPVDLLWNGGIGTYVKASHETHREVDDVTNDLLRVNADELRCKAVGEGGNLGFTQAARVEYGLRGGRLNTDAVDNSGGVDMSDHEVNLKILLSPLVADGTLTTEARNELIRELTDEIADQVLRNNDDNSRLMSLDLVRSASDPVPFGRAIDWVCRESGLSRAALSLPSDAAIEKRAAAGLGLARPELAVLAAHVKMRVYKELLDSDISGIPDFEGRVRRYFPSRVYERYPEAIDRHMLRKAIGLTVSLNEIVSDFGAAFFPTLIELTGASPVEILEMAIKVSEGLGLARLREDLNRCPAAPDSAYTAWTYVSTGVHKLMAASLGAGASAGRVPIEEIKAVMDTMSRSRSKAVNGPIDQQRNELIKRRVPKALAQRCVGMRNLTLAREIARVQARTGDSARVAVVRYLSIGHASRIVKAIEALANRRATGRWDPLAFGILRNRYFELLQLMVDRVEMGPELLRLSVDRAAHQLYWRNLKEQADTLDAILGNAPDLGAFMVAEERIRSSLK